MPSNHQAVDPGEIVVLIKGDVAGPLQKQLDHDASLEPGQCCPDTEMEPSTETEVMSRRWAIQEKRSRLVELVRIAVTGCLQQQN